MGFNFWVAKISNIFWVCLIFQIFFDAGSQPTYEEKNESYPPWALDKGAPIVIFVFLFLNLNMLCVLKITVSLRTVSMRRLF